MPRGDGTGPAGMGPMTGRAAGVCAGYGVPGYMNPVGGRRFGYWGWGRGRGGGRGRRHWFWATGLPGWARAGYGPWGGTAAPFAAPAAPTAQQELDALKQQAAYFKDALDDIQKRIGELEAEASAQT
jgi:hypothetical protein